MDLDARLNELYQLLSADRPGAAVRTDRSVLIVYPPGEELALQDKLPTLWVRLDAAGVCYEELDLSALAFEALAADGLLDDVLRYEFVHYHQMRRSVAGLVEPLLRRRIEEASARVATGAVILNHTPSLFPLVRFADVLAGLRHLPSRLVMMFPGEERDGKLHLLNQPDGYNYLAIKIS